MNGFSFISYKYIKKALFIIALLVATVSCSDESVGNRDYPESDKSGLTVKGSIRIPDAPDITTRGIMGETPKADLKLTIFEFDKGSDAEHSFLSNIYNATITSESTAVGNNGVVTFEFTLKAATTPKELHLFIANDNLTSEYGSVASILPSLTIGSPGSEYEAYWGSADFPNGFTDISDAEGVPTLLPEVTQKLTQVPVIRNFAMVSVSESLDNFELLGWDLVNVPTSGTVAPWNKSTQNIPLLLNADNSMKVYDEIEYGGIVPGNAQFRNLESDAKQWTATSQNMLSRNPRFLYEHPYESTRRTYLIIHGKYTDNNNVSTTGFYKLDLGVQNNTDGTFTYYNLIRNIHYKVNITRALSPGTSTVAEAIARAPFNNLIGAVETSSILNVSNGQNMLIVNDTNHIIIDNNQTVDVLYRYIKDILTDKQTDNTAAGPIGLTIGDVIKGFSEPEDITINGVSWRRIRLQINNPTNTVKTQKFYIVDNDGLGRTINLILRRPWQYAKIGNTDFTATIAPNTNNLYTIASPQPISKDAQQPATVYFNLPNDLPESMFPLDFTLEALNQGLENHKSDNMVVNTGSTLFPTGDNEDFVTIQYIKTVTYQEYMHPYVNDGSNDINTGVINANHTIRCRFQTTTTVAVGSDGEVIIHNEYFRPDASVKFKRQ